MQRSLYPRGALWTGAGINYGNDRIFDSFYNPAAIMAELQFLHQYFHRLRIFILDYSYGVSHPYTQRCLYIIDQARSIGFTDIVWGITSSASTLTAANYATYKTAMLDRAKLANDHGVTTFVTGNEEEYHVDGTSLVAAQMTTNARNDLAPAATTVFAGDVSYNLPEGNLPDWLANGSGSLSTLGLNAYGLNEHDGAGFCRDVRNFAARFGSQGYVSEFGINTNWATVTASDSDQERELRKRTMFVRNSGLSASYFFLFSHLSDDNFALKLANGNFRSMWFALVRERKWFTGVPNATVQSLRVQRP